MTMACFFAACRIGISSYSFVHVECDQHCDDNLAPMYTSVLKDVAVLGLYGVVQLVGHDEVMRLLALQRSQNSICHVTAARVSRFVCKFKTGSLFHIPMLPVNKRSKKRSGTVLHVPGHEIHWLREIQFVSSLGCKSQWLKIDGAMGSTGRGDVIFARRKVLNDVELLFERDAGWNSDMSTVSRRCKWNVKCCQMN